MIEIRPVTIPSPLSPSKTWYTPSVYRPSVTLTPSNTNSESLRHQLDGLAVVVSLSLDDIDALGRQ